MSVIFFTGFPGFLGSELLPRVLERSPECRAICLCQSKYLPLARERLASIEAEYPAIRGRVQLTMGDITRPQLGLAKGCPWQSDVREIFHLAAVYDLSVQRELGMRVNVKGTQNILDFAEEAVSLRRLHYVSTCYVSGRHVGRFTEEDLQKGQSFNNFYEETKYLAEVEVQARLRGGLPTTVYRPSVVIGDSRTGATQKYDGPYYVIRWLLRQRRIAFLPVMGNAKRTQVNLVPRDFVVDAILHLSQREASVGKVYQLADPHPLTVDQLIRLLAKSTQRTIVRVPCPLKLATFAIDHLPGVYEFMRIPSSTVHYFVHPTTYSCENALSDLQGSGVAVPPLASYVDRMVEFVRSHPEIESGAMA